MSSPEYDKYHNMVQEFKQFKNNTGGDMRVFLKEVYGLEGDAATIEMRKIENIVHGDHMSKSACRNRRREMRTQKFNKMFEL
jgi:hypothetical protein